MWDSNRDGFPGLAGDWNRVCIVPVMEMGPSVKDLPCLLSLFTLGQHECLVSVLAFSFVSGSVPLTAAIWFTGWPERSSV